MRGWRIDTVVGVLAVFAGIPAVDAQDTRTAEVELRVEIAARTVEFGAPFPITVVRAWHRSLRPEPWRDDALAPIVLRAIAVDETVRGERIEETRRFAGHLFELGAVAVPAVSFTAHASGDGTPHHATAAPPTIDVSSALGDAATAAIELPDGPFPAPLPWLRWTILAGVATALAATLGWTGVVVVRRRRRSAAPPEVAALAGLAELGRRILPADRDALRVDAVAASDIARTYLQARFDLRSREQTSDEFLLDPATHRALAPRHRAALQRILAHYDSVKFARGSPSAAEREDLLGAIAALVRATAARPRSRAS